MKKVIHYKMTEFNFSKHGSNCKNFHGLWLLVLIGFGSDNLEALFSWAEKWDSYMAEVEG